MKTAQAVTEPGEEPRWTPHNATSLKRSRERYPDSVSERPDRRDVASVEREKKGTDYRTDPETAVRNRFF